ncbi:hypothetical protein ACAF76_008225 [Brevibacillus sp. TJ4]|uniref:hypothetical protein n=1 Tax=Brevibacillus sp. TJ4 TaxID=3234853 RepID=UPI0037D93061
MSIIRRNPDYVQAADELKQALVNYCYEVSKVAPELKDQTDQLQRSVLLQENTIFNQIRVKENSPS